MQKCSLISIVGKPNAGKSTLLNQIIGQKISIVSPKVQTTRCIMKGIFTESNTQLIFLDTPGIFAPQKTLEKAMVRCAWSSIAGADIICLIIDIFQTSINDSEFENILKFLSKEDRPIFVIFNKIDLLEKKPHSKSFLEIIKNYKDILLLAEFNKIINDAPQIQDLPYKGLINSLASALPTAQSLFISAEAKTGVNNFVKTLQNLSPNRPWLYEEDDITTAPMRFLAAEITREHLFRQLEQELPYNLTVETDSWEQIRDGEVKIHQTVIVSRQAHKKIILGKNGNMIKEVSKTSRMEIDENLQLKTHLFLFVKVREDWDKKAIYYQNMGLDFPNKI